MVKLAKNKDFWAILGLIIFLCIGFCLFFGYNGNLLIDCGREAYLPTVVFDKNFIMYKDIFNLYPPLSYQFNGLLYKIFGTNLNVLYFASFINAIIIVLATYYISKKFLNTLLSFSICSFLIFYDIFGYITNIFEYIYSSIEFLFPYAYAYVYALSMFLVSLALFLKFIKAENNLYLLFLSFLFMGLSIANKFEFALTPLVYLVALFVLKIKIKPINFIQLLFYLFLPSIISFGYIIVNGWNYSDIINYLEFGKRFFASDSYKNFSSVSLRLFPSSILYFLIHISGFIPLGLFLNKNRKLNNKNIFLLLLLTILGLIPFLIFYSAQITSLYWLCASTIFIAFYVLLKILKSFSKNDFIFLITIIIFILSTIKIKFCLGKNTYGNYLIPFFVLIHIIFIENYFKSIFKRFNLTIFISSILISISLLTACINTFMVHHHKNYKIITPKGMIWVDERTGKPFNKLITYINKNTSKNDKILALQEGVMLNFFTDRPTDLMLYHLINIHIEALGEDYIIDRLQSEPPDYIVEIYTRHLTPKIKEFIKENYNIEQFFDFIILYKHKK